MSNTLTDKEVQNLIIIGNRIYKSLECGDGEHVPCRTDRLEACLLYTSPSPRD